MKVLSIDCGQKNLALCVLRNKEEILQWVVCDVPRIEAREVAEQLATIMKEWEYDAVVIERQPGPNVKMQRMQSLLEMYFVLSSPKNVPVSRMEAKRKLIHAASTPYWPPGKLLENIKTYHARKKIAVETVSKFLGDTHQQPQFQELFKGTKKKDDLADCLLQALAFFNVLVENVQ